MEMYDPKVLRHVMTACGGYATAAECSTVKRVTVAWTTLPDPFKHLLSWDDKQSLF